MMRRRTSAPKPAARVFSYSSRRSAPSVAQPEAHAVVARQVRRRLGRGDDVVGRQPVFRVRQRHVDDLGAGRRAARPGPAATAPRSPPACRRMRYSRGTPMRMPLHAARAGGGEVGHRHVGAGGILRIVPGHRAQQDRAILHRAGERPGLVERGGERHDAPARAPPIGRLDAGDAAERGRLADRAAGVGRRSPPAPAAPPPPRPTRRTSRPAPARRCCPGAASTGSPPRPRPRSCSTSPWRTRPCSPCRGTPRRRAAGWR